MNHDIALLSFIENDMSIIKYQIAQLSLRTLLHTEKCIFLDRMKVLDYM